MVCLFNSKKERTTISYARYLMSVKLNRFLDRNEEVDHIDNDKTNDSIENLQILSSKENKEKFLRTLPLTSEHGTWSMYRRGCRCIECKKFKADYWKHYRLTHPEKIKIMNLKKRERRAQRKLQTI